MASRMDPVPKKAKKAIFPPELCLVTVVANFSGDMPRQSTVIEIDDLERRDDISRDGTSAGYGFVKQLDGPYNYLGTTVDDLKLMREQSSRIFQTKAAGDVRTSNNLSHVKSLGERAITNEPTTVTFEPVQEKAEAYSTDLNVKGSIATRYRPDIEDHQIKRTGSDDSDGHAKDLVDECWISRRQRQMHRRRRNRDDSPPNLNAAKSTTKNGFAREDQVG
ncbi:hypothetical protein N7539_004777 [Penicillium diatomitis]|uniref:Uncharacterized protein n=1 Tax=Penicillium diatomitis TaxID=2819901 RepID=A0A9W9X611_9EURO|nr:uncharacterized protein N7539_004777 [Penicillium diatomitis]KAJ5484789.1 hypothetical protein N7539_004777 [Penicillium diatomitis]